MNLDNVKKVLLKNQSRSYGPHLWFSTEAEEIEKFCMDKNIYL